MVSWEAHDAYPARISASESDAHTSLCSTVIALPLVVVVVPSCWFRDIVPTEVQIKFKSEKKFFYVRALSHNPQLLVTQINGSDFTSMGAVTSGSPFQYSIERRCLRRSIGTFALNEYTSAVLSFTMSRPGHQHHRLPYLSTPRIKMITAALAFTPPFCKHLFIMLSPFPYKIQRNDQRSNKHNQTKIE